MPRPHPPEFRARAIELARERAKPMAELAHDLGISESCLRNWVAKADVDEGRKEGVTTSERAEVHVHARGVRLGPGELALSQPSP